MKLTYYIKILRQNSKFHLNKSGRVYVEVSQKGGVTKNDLFSLWNIIIWYFSSIHADIRNTVYCVGVQAGGTREWNFAWERFKAASAPSERELLLSVLGCTRAPYLLYRFEKILTIM